MSIVSSHRNADCNECGDILRLLLARRIGTISQLVPKYAVLPESLVVSWLREPGTLVGPDLAVVQVDRPPADFPRQSFFDIASDFVIEIQSPSERLGQINDKISAYLIASVRMIWLTNPE